MEAIDIEDFPSLLAYLRVHGWIGPAEQVRMRKLEGGVSNRTVLIERAGGAWVLKQALAKLRVPADWYSRPERIDREAAGLLWLEKLAPPGTITPLVFQDPGQHLLAMEAVPQPHENWKSVLLAGTIEPGHFRSFATLLATIHREGYRMRDQLRPVFEDRSFFESLRLEPYFRYSAEQAPEAAEFINALLADTLACRISLVHGDYSPKNVLIHDGRLVLLDHEVIHFGDPAFDVGFSLTHFLSKAHHLPPSRRTLAEAAADYWRTYKDSLGRLPWVAELEDRAVRHTLACLLARVVGRSRLEYLDQRERTRQREVVLEMMRCQPPGIAALVNEFVARLEKCQPSKA